MLIRLFVLFGLCVFYGQSQTPIPGFGGGGGATVVNPPKEFIAAICDNVTAIGGFAKPTSNPPTPACVTGSNTTYGVLNFDHTQTESVQERFRMHLVPTSMNVVIEWSTAATSGNVVWGIAGICIDDTESLDTAFASEQLFAADTADGTANRKNSVTLTGVTIASCTDGDTYMFKARRAADDGNDTIDATDADLISLTFVMID